MLTKRECQLCSDARRTVEDKLPSELLAKLEFEDVDITDDGNEALYDRWRYEIPVFYLNGKYLCKNRIDIDKLSQMMSKK